MYNVWKSERESEAQSRIDHLKKSEENRSFVKRGTLRYYKSNSNKLLEKQERLTHNYKKRVENFVLQVSKPLSTHKLTCLLLLMLDAGKPYPMQPA